MYWEITFLTIYHQRSGFNSKTALDFILKSHNCDHKILWLVGFAVTQTQWPLYRCMVTTRVFQMTPFMTT